MRLKRYAPLGRCMYCLASGVPLSEEHLIPRSLGGRLTLRDAVCPPCQALTGRPEQAALATEFLVPRTLLALKRPRARRSSRKTSPRPLPAVALAGDCEADESIGDDTSSAADFPRRFSLPAFEPAGRLVDIDRGDTAPRMSPIECRLQLGRPARDRAARATLPADPTAYGYSLAKWAYGLAVAERGLAGCDTTALRQLLAGDRHDVFNFVGSPSACEAPVREWLHHFELRERAGWRVVSLNLLGSAGLPPYEIAIGTLVA